MEEKSIYDKAVEAANYISEACKMNPTIGITLGSGLGEYAKV